FTVRATASTGHATEPVTISWNYENGSPASQVITGTDFGPITLDASQRSYTYTPATSGSKQFTIEAALDGTSTTATPTSRHRAVGKAIVTASSCATAHATTHYDVADCAPPEITLYAPPTVISGTTITLAIAAQAGATATWSIHNGTPTIATGNTISVAAGTTGTLDLTVRLTRGSCNAE